MLADVPAVLDPQILFLERQIDEYKKIHDQQPETFEFSKPNLDAAEIILKNIQVIEKKVL